MRRGDEKGACALTLAEAFLLIGAAGQFVRDEPDEAEAAWLVSDDVRRLHCECRSAAVGSDTFGRLLLHGVHKCAPDSMLLHMCRRPKDGTVAELPVFTIRSDPSSGEIKSIEDVYRLKSGKGQWEHQQEQSKP